MMLLLSGLAFAGLFGPKDHDGDGIRDKDDTCKHRDEVYNGYQDEDGCPDKLSAIEIAVYVNDVWARNAPLTVRVGDETETYQGRMVARDLFPDTRVQAVSRIGCFDGELNTVLGAEPRRVRLNLQPRTREVTLVVQDLDTGAPGRARVRWNEIEGCGPQGPMRVNREKRVLLGIGEHTVGLGRAGRTAYDFVVEPDTTVVVIPASASAYGASEDDTAADELPPVLYFHTNSATLLPAHDALLQDVKKWMDEHPDRRVGVVGHTDERASDLYNDQLGQRRAEAATAGLIALGVAPDRLEVMSRGEDQPADEGWGDEAMAKNRRVVFVALGPDTGRRRVGRTDR